MSNDANPWRLAGHLLWKTRLLKQIWSGGKVAFLLHPSNPSCWYSKSQEIISRNKRKTKDELDYIFKTNYLLTFSPGLSYLHLWTGNEHYAMAFENVIASNISLQRLKVNKILSVFIINFLDSFFRVLGYNNGIYLRLSPTL